MKIIIISLKSKFIIFLIVTTFGLSFLAFIPIRPVNAASYTDVSVQTAHDMINNHMLYPNLLILDVREQFEYDASHLIDAILVPLGEIDSRINELLPYNDTEILVYCRTGARSAVASQNLAGNHNFTKIYNMLGGITDWIAAGYSVWPNNNGQPQLQPTIDFSLAPFLLILLGTISVILIYYNKRRNK